MCASIQDARAVLIRQERISTIARLSSSIVHDLRNPLASIYGGAEMMMDGDLSEAQMHRIAGNIYRSSRAINELLRELVDVSRGRNQTHRSLPPERSRRSRGRCSIRPRPISQVSRLKPISIHRLNSRSSEPALNAFS